ncbi:hypothetical protein FOHLNKBM_6294 [Methylobacterium longum]|nr:hypothetical protein FOHLNKBM_6294 [Methylobacterium longum]
MNRALRSRGEASVNAKRVLRILRANGLTLAPHTARRPGRTHDGIVVALRSNVRWCSDHLELRCRDGAVVRVLFAIDACDREIMAWSATTTGVSAAMVCDLMIACCERRFGATKTPHPVEWLSDNGSAYIAKETAQTAAPLGLRLLFTPVRSPQSNGIAEAFVKTLKRDYGPPRHLGRRRDRDAAFAGLVRGLQHDPPALRPAHALAPRVPQPECLNPPRCLSGQTGCTPPVSVSARGMPSASVRT